MATPPQAPLPIALFCPEGANCTNYKDGLPWKSKDFDIEDKAQVNMPVSRWYYKKLLQTMRRLHRQAAQLV